MPSASPTVLHDDLSPAEAAEASGALPRGALVDRYEVLGLLGMGGMARVYRVRHRQLGSLHALKVLALDRPGLRRRALQEGRLQATLRHPHVVAVTDIVTTAGAPALVLEYVAGPSLDRLLQARSLRCEEVDALARGVLRGVAHAHAHQVVHRDLKPANILLELVDDTLVPRVTDFGLAKLLALLPSEPGGMGTIAGTTMGTPPYMAPEQALDASEVDARADVWALGVVLLEMLLLEPMTLDRWPPARLVELPGDVPARMRRAIEAALSPDPAQRPADAAALLDLWTDGQPDMGAGSARCSAATLAAAFALRPQLRDVGARSVSTLGSGPAAPRPARRAGGLGLLALLALLSVGAGLTLAWLS